VCTRCVPADQVCLARRRPSIGACPLRTSPAERLSPRTVVVQPSRRASDDDQIGLVDPGRDRAGRSIAEAVSAGRVGASCSASAHSSVARFGRAAG